MLCTVIGAAGSDVRVRPATTGDVEAMHRIRLAVRENRLSDPDSVRPEDYGNRLAAGGIAMVAEVNGGIVGFAVGDIQSASIWALFVDPSAQRRGVGRVLHDALVDAMFATGLRQLHLSTDPGTRAEGFYQRAGWEPTGDTAGGEVCYRLPAEGWQR